MQTPRLSEGAGQQIRSSAQKRVSGVGGGSADFYFLVGSRLRRTIRLPRVAHNAGDVLLAVLATGPSAPGFPCTSLTALPAPWFWLRHRPSFLLSSESGSPGFLKTYESFPMFSVNVLFVCLFKCGLVGLCWDRMPPSEIHMSKPGSPIRRGGL